MIQDLKNAIGLDNLPDFINDVKGFFSSAWEAIFDPDSFESDQFPAIIISKPGQISPAEYTALGYSDGDIPSDISLQKFKVRIINTDMNPHAVLTDPCDITTALDKCVQNAVVATHTTIAAPAHLVKGATLGSFVTIRLDKLPNKTFNIHTGHLVEVKQYNNSGHNVLSQEACDSISNMFIESNKVTELPPPIEIQSAYATLASKYDSLKGYPSYFKKENERFFKNLNPYMTMVVKAWFFLCYTKLGYSGIITSGFRSQADQTRLYNAYIARGKTGLPAAKYVAYHGAKVAVDLNFQFPANAAARLNAAGATMLGSVKGMKDQGIKQTRDQNKNMWQLSGVVELAMALGLEWGGNWTGRMYDPIHFQISAGEIGYTREQILSAARGGEELSITVVTGTSDKSDSSVLPNDDADINSDLGVSATDAGDYLADALESEVNVPMGRPPTSDKDATPDAIKSYKPSEKGRTGRSKATTSADFHDPY